MIQAIFFLDRIVIKFFNPLPFLIHFSTGESNIIYKNNEMSSGDFYLLKMFKVMNFFLSVYALSTPFTQSFSEFEHQWKFKKKKKQSPAVEPYIFLPLSRCRYWFFEFIDGAR